jgi:hypothetical protein
MELRVDRELEDAAVALPCDRAEKGREEASRRALFMCWASLCLLHCLASMGCVGTRWADAASTSRSQTRPVVLYYTRAALKRSTARRPKSDADDDEFLNPEPTHLPSYRLWSGAAVRCCGNWKRFRQKTRDVPDTARTELRPNRRRWSTYWPHGRCTVALIRSRPRESLTSGRAPGGALDGSQAGDRTFSRYCSPETAECPRVASCDPEIPESLTRHSAFGLLRPRRFSRSRLPTSHRTAATSPGAVYWPPAACSAASSASSSLAAWSDMCRLWAAWSCPHPTPQKGRNPPIARFPGISEELAAWFQQLLAYTNTHFGCRLLQSSASELRAGHLLRASPALNRAQTGCLKVRAWISGKSIPPPAGKAIAIRLDRHRSNEEQPAQMRDEVR